MYVLELFCWELVCVGTARLKFIFLLMLLLSQDHDAAEVQ